MQSRGRRRDHSPALRLEFESLETRHLLTGHDLFTLPSNVELRRGVEDGILANDSSPNGEPVRIVSHTFPSHGRLELGAEGQFEYLPNIDFAGIDSFSYFASDGQSEPVETNVVFRVGLYTDLVLSQGPLAYWKLDENSTSASVRDESGNEIHGEYRGLAETGQSGAILAEVGASVRLGNGATSINFGDPNPLLRLRNNLTVEAWVKPQTLAGHNRILGTSTRQIQSGIGFGIFDGQLIFTTFGRKDHISDPVFEHTDDWYHVGAVFDSDNDVTFFLNGENIGRVEGDSPAAIGRGNVVLGTKSGQNETFNGWLDEVAVYGHPLSSADFQMRYQMGLLNQGKIPIAQGESFELNYTAETQLTIREDELLANDYDEDSEQLFVTIMDQPSHGKVTRTENGSVHYELAGGFQPFDSFTYAVSDGKQISTPVTVELHFSRIVGDANEDGVFDSSDLVQIFQAGEYEDEKPANSIYAEGDWNGDGEFDSSDLVFAFQFGRYFTIL